MKLEFLYFISVLLQSGYDSKQIIVWHTKRLYPHLSDPQEIQCGKEVCTSTKKRTLARNEKQVAYMFYGTDFEVEDLPLPRLKRDIWALLHEESPMNNYLFSHSLGIKLFNFTSTFRRESDYPLTTQFIPSLEYLTERLPIDLSAKNKLRQNGFSPVLYVQSHCSVASDRDRYIAELSKFIPIDSYGKCLNNKSLPESLSSTDKYENEEFLQFIAQYKFHLAFENAICDDYMTEKLFRALHVGSVPVYRGSSRVRDWMPDENSVIVVDDFDSPKQLADYLIKLDQSDDEYNSFLKFKRTKVINNKLLRKAIESREWGINDLEKVDFILGFECYVCKRITDYAKHLQKCFGKNCENLSYIATKDHMGCQQPYPSLETELERDDKWVQESWIDSYWYGLDLAKAIHKMIEVGEKKSSRIFQYIMALKYTH